jgi:hypothetical protein
MLPVYHILIDLGGKFLPVFSILLSIKINNGSENVEIQPYGIENIFDVKLVL